MNILYTQEITVHNPPKSLKEEVDLVIEMMNSALMGSLSGEVWNSVKPVFSKVDLTNRTEAKVDVYSSSDKILYSFTLKENPNSHFWECTTDVVKLFATVTAYISSIYR